ncbi:ribonuclease III [Bacteroidota bacterium]
MRGLFYFLLYRFRKKQLFYNNLVDILGFLPTRLSVYKLAFTHKSASIRLNDGTHINNERLEYLGDAILGAVVAEFIYREFGYTDEGFMTKLRARIVKRKTLNTIAISMGIPLMITSQQQTSNSAKHLYGNALEALIGAIYIDKGFAFTLRFFKKRIVQKHLDMHALVKKDSDYKSQLIEWAQKAKKEVQFFSNEEYDARNKIPRFQAIVRIDHEDFGIGSGDSKKDAEQQAAKVALKEISN